MSKDTIYSFFISCGVHLAVLTFAFLTIKGTDRVIPEKMSFTKVSFKQIKDSRIKKMLSRIDEIKKQAVFNIPGITSKDKPLETGKILTAIKRKRSKQGNTLLKNKKYKKELDIDAVTSSKDLLFKGKATGIDKSRLSGTIGKDAPVLSKSKKKYGGTTIDVNPASRKSNDTIFDNLLPGTGSTGSDTIEEPVGTGFSGGTASKTPAETGTSFPETTGGVSDGNEVYDDFSAFDSGEIQQKISGNSEGKLILDSAGTSGIGVTIVGEIRSRKIIKSYMPEYPEWLKGKGIEPVVVLRFTVLPSGRVKDTVFIKRTSGFIKLDKLTINELKKWVFAPLTKGSISKEETGEITFKFSLK
ncbi:MAG: TonB family protein [Elusimicrobia bacterium]|nr:TonB family protein [Elusimicrobiota bacterium]